jgi:hypothetical protein
VDVDECRLPTDFVIAIGHRNHDAFMQAHDELQTRRIDQRIEEMIEAVGRFPPLPQWFQGLAMPFEFGFPFPEALRE